MNNTSNSNSNSIIFNLKILYSALSRKEKNRFLTLQLLVIFSASIELLSISLVSPYIEYVTNGEVNSFFNTLNNMLGLEGDTRVLFGIGLIILLFIGSFSSAISLWYLAHFAADLGLGLSSKIYKKIILSDYVDFRSYKKNEIVNIVTNETTRLTDQVIQPLMIINSKIFLIILISVVMSWTSPLLSLLALLTFSTSYLFIYFIVRKKLDRNSSDITRLNKSRLLNIDDTVSVFKELYIYNKLNSQYKDFFDQGKLLAKRKGQSAAISQVPRFLIEYLALMVVLMAFVIESSGEGGLVGAVAAISGFGVAAFKLLPAAQQTYASVAMIKANSTALKEMTLWFRGVDAAIATKLPTKSNHRMSCRESIYLK
ncbi:ABC transporter transmembrane domain-containing protein, partial [Vibrio cyclitrophicus]